MTYKEYISQIDDLIALHICGQLTDTQLERELEMLQEEYEENCEDY